MLTTHSPTVDRPARRHRAIALILGGLLGACTSDPITAPEGALNDAAVESAQASVENHSDDATIQINNRFAYVWADQPSPAIGVWYTPQTSFSHNARGYTNRVRRNAIGHYEVSFNAMLHPNAPNEKVTLLVTAYGSTLSRCFIRKWGQNNANTLVASVGCISPSGAFADARFTLLFVGNNTLLGRSGFARAQKAGVASYTPYGPWSHNSGGGPITASRFGTGVYQMDLSLPRPPGGLPENYFITTVTGSGGTHCNNGGWGSTVGVRCYSRFTGAPADAQYNALLVEQGRTGKRLGFAWANSPTSPSYTPSTSYSRNSSGGGISILRSGTGQYRVSFSGLMKLSGHTENVQVSAYTGGFVFCNVVNWGNSASGLDVNVECRSRTGALVDNFFTVLVIE
ncbi:MAG: hypothetical protein ABI877_02945 [Gemmatimonadaceae bacterium]